MDFQFTETERPETTRATKPNPFSEAVKGIKGTDKTLSFSVKADAPDARNVKAVTRQLREAGKPNDCTVRQVREWNAKTKTVVFKFWTTDKITHADASETK